MPSEQASDLKALVADMNAGKVQWLVMLGVNPLYNAPADLAFEVAFNKVPNTVHLGSHVDETGFYSTWHINKAHYLESWSDARAYDGTISIVQPMIEPLYAGKSAHDVLQTLLDPSVSAYNAVLANAKTYLGGGGGAAASAAAGAGEELAASVSPDQAAKAALGLAAASTPLELAWRKALHDGWIANTAFTPKTLGAPKGGAAAATLRQRDRDQLQAGCFGVRRPLCEQRLAAGAAPAGDEHELG